MATISNNPFRPVRGTQEQINALTTYHEGYIYFATDTGKIYMDNNDVRVPLGGGGIQLLYSSDEKVIQNPDDTYALKLDSLSEESENPKESDLIINTSNGCFYKIISINESSNLILASLLAVSGSGGGGGGGGSGGDTTSSITLTLTSLPPMYYVFGQDSYITMVAQTEATQTVVYTVTVITPSSERITTTSEPKPVGAAYSFNVGPLLQLGMNSILVTVTGDNAGSTTKTYSRRTCVELGLRQAAGFDPTNKLSTSEKSVISVIPVGTGLDKTIRATVDGYEVFNRSGVTISETSFAVIFDPVKYPDIITHGAHDIEISLSATIDGTVVYTEPLNYQLAFVNSNDSTPIIWFGDYPTTITNYESLRIPFMVYDGTNTPTVQFYKEVNGEYVIMANGEINLTDALTKVGFYTYEVLDYKVGENNFQVKLNNSVSKEFSVQVKPDSREMDIIDDGATLLLNYSAAGRSNVESLSRRSQWLSTGYLKSPIVFNNFNWYSNGWVSDEDSNSCLRLSNGASIEIPLGARSFNDKSDYTIEVRFKVHNIQSYSTLISNETQDTGEVNDYGYPIITVIKTVSTEKGVFGKYLTSNNGFCLGTQEAYFNANSTIVNSRYKEDAIVTVTFVVSHTTKLLTMYLDGVLSGIQKLSTSFNVNTNNFILNSNYCDVDLYNVRFYSKELSLGDIVHNYIADFKDIQLYDENQVFVNKTIPATNETYIDISLAKLREYNASHPDKLSMPYAILELTHTDDVDGAGVKNTYLPYFKGNNRSVNVTFVNPSLDKAYTDGLINADKYLHSAPSYQANKADINVQGTSSQGYPRRNYKLKFKGSKWNLTNEKYITAFPDGVALKKWYMDNDYVATNKFTWKIDYMESSGSYNTGFANMAETMYSKHPLTDYGMGDADAKYRTSVYGFPILVFQKEGNDVNEDNNYKFIGRYNCNLDKGSNEYYGFEDPSVQAFIPKTGDAPFNFGQVAECWEFSDNQGTYCSFEDTNFDAKDSTDGLLEIINHFEYRYAAPDLNLGDAEVPASIAGFLDGEDGDVRLDEIYALHTNDVPETNYFSMADAGSKAVINDFLKFKHRHLESAARWLESVNTATGHVPNTVFPDIAGTAIKTSQYITGTTIYYSDNVNFNEEFSFTTITDFNNYAQNHDVYVSTDGNVTYHVDNTWGADKLYYRYDGLNSSSLPIYTYLSFADETAFNNYVNAHDNIYYIPSHYGCAKDNITYRNAKFKKEFEKHFNKEYCIVYFILTELLLLYDSRGKNLMLASWGPQEVGGDYIWYPIFYDIDTQLGINNTGIPTWDYDTDATEGNCFSTPNSVLWQGLFANFYNEIKAKYTQMRSAGTISYNKIEGYYACDPDITKSYAMQGQRPLVAINVDEWYKYIGPVKTGYINTSGENGYDSGSFYYACQGDRKLSRELLIRNRLNYIDSWWQAGTYAASAKETALWMRTNANDLNVATNLISDTVAATVGQEDAYVWNRLDARPEFKITPFLNQHVAVLYDDTLTPSVKSLSTQVTPEVPRNIEIGYKSAKNRNQQLEYVLGAEYLSDLGDLSRKYVNEFHFKYGTRMKSLILGSDDEGYYNNFTSSTDWIDLGDGANEATKKPLLEKIVLTGMSGLSQALDVSGSEKLKEFRALKTQISKATLAKGVAVQTLHLPYTIQEFVLRDAPDLTNMLYVKPVVADGVAPKGLYLEGITDTVEMGKEPRLLRLDIVSGNLGYGSYEILNNSIAYKETLDKNTQANSKYLAINLEDVVWTPYVKVESDTVYSGTASYFIKTNHYSYEDYQYNNDADWKYDIKNGKVFQKNAAIVPKVTNFDLLDILVDSYRDTSKYDNDGMNFYTNTSNSLKPTLPNITGDLYVDNTNAVDELVLQNKYCKSFPDLNIFVKNIVKAKTARFISVVNDIEQEFAMFKASSTYSGTFTDFAADPNGQDYKDITATREHYVFQGWSMTEDNAIVDVGTLVFDKDYEFHAVWKVATYVVTYLNPYDSTYEVEFEIDYGEKFQLPTVIPYRDDSDLPRTKTWRFMGYTFSPSSSALIDFSSSTARVTRNITVYAYFGENGVSVYEMPTSTDCFSFSLNFDEESYTLTGMNLQNVTMGKIVIPTTYNGKPVTAIGNQAFDYYSDMYEETHEATNSIDYMTFRRDNPATGKPWTVQERSALCPTLGITHVFFFPENSTTITTIKSQAFAYCYSLKYLELPTTVTVIESQGCMTQGRSLTLKDNMLNVKNIGTSSFRAFSFADVFTLVSPLVFGEKVETIGIEAFTNMFDTKADPIYIQFGSINKPTSITSIGSGAFDGSGDNNKFVFTVMTTPDKMAALQSGVFSPSSLSVIGAGATEITVNYVNANTSQAL